ncbi:cell wall hydrolase [Streptomyces sp. NPDC021749]|uniref:cell wall hydrolase n=1 Tax=Streptomyces sp. NPDC021749 TaxID=3154905 RepID=UPI00340864FD
MTTDPSRQVPAVPGPVAFADLPPALHNVTYSGARHPGATAPECPSYGGWAAGGGDGARGGSGTTTGRGADGFGGLGGDGGLGGLGGLGDSDGPGGSDGFGDLAEGANCQRYAYAVLRHFGLWVPPLRSAELWADTRATRQAGRPRPLDLVLFDAGPVRGRPEGYGAHVGVHLGLDAVLHLCREVGRPAVWRYGDFAARARYARFLGAKRLRGAAPGR